METIKQLRQKKITEVVPVIFEEVRKIGTSRSGFNISESHEWFSVERIKVNQDGFEIELTIDITPDYNFNEISIDIEAECFYYDDGIHELEFGDEEIESVINEVRKEVEKYIPDDLFDDYEPYPW